MNTKNNLFRKSGDGRRSFRNDERGVSAVIGVILMIAITVVIAAIIASFAYGIGSPDVAPNAAISIESATAGTNEFFVVHNGGDAIVDACDPNAASDIDQADWKNMQVRINGEVCGANAVDANPADLLDGQQQLNGVGLTGAMFDLTVGDRLRLYTDGANSQLALGDEIIVIHVPTNTILASKTIT